MTIQTVRCFNVNILSLCISAVDNARKLKFCSYDHLQSINKKFSTFEDGSYISGLEQQKLILSSYFLLAFINTFHIVTLG